MSARELRNIKIPAPELSIQKDIIAKLKIEDAKESALAIRTRVMLETLAERRQALISAAVTGKLEVTDGYS
jgi:type I restriction enzyme S subunit